MRIPAREITPKDVYLTRRRLLAALVAAPAAASPFSTSEKETPHNDATTYNNFYEFGTQKDQPAKLAGSLNSPWTVTVEGDVAKPRRFDLDDLRKLAPLEERIYRLRCVEGWSMVVPWIGFPLSALLKRVEPTAKAKYVAFETLYDSQADAAGALRRASASRTWRACGWTRPCTRWRCWPRACTARRCRTRTARRCGWWCRGSTVSRASSRS